MIKRFRKFIRKLVRRDSTTSPVPALRGILALLIIVLAAISAQAQSNPPLRVRQCCD